MKTIRSTNRSRRALMPCGGNECVYRLADNALDLYLIQRFSGKPFPSTS
jgi:hypothetical protein